MSDTKSDTIKPLCDIRTDAKEVTPESRTSMQVLREYELMGKDPHEWLHYGNALKQVVDMLRMEIENVGSARPTWRVFGLSYSYYFLAGLSLENLFKGILIGRDQTIISDGQMNLKRLTGTGNGHDLLSLAKKVVSTIEVSLSQKEKTLLQKLQHRTVNGKYPIPLNVKDYNPTDLIPSDFEIIDGMFEKFSAILKNETPDPVHDHIDHPYSSRV